MSLLQQAVDFFKSGDLFKSEKPQPPPDDLGEPLVRGRLYRVWARVDASYVDRVYREAPEGQGQTHVQEQLARDLTTAGFGRPLLVTQDPSDPAVWTFLAPYKSRSPLSSPHAGPLELVHFDPVDEPLSASPLAHLESLDVGLSEDDVFLLRYALRTEGDPKRLAGIARCYDEDFPIAAAIVRNKAHLENLSRVVNRETGPIRAEDANGRLSAMSSTEHATLDALKKFSEALDEGSYLDLYANVFHTLAWKPIREAEEHGQASLDVLEPDLAGLSKQEREEGFGKVVTFFSRDPMLAREENLEILSSETGLPPVLLSAAITAVADLGHGLVTLDPRMVRAFRPQGPHPVPVSALKMAHATLRPEESLSAAPEELGKVLRDLKKSSRKGDPEAVKAEKALERARRMLDRLNWIAWTKRYQAAERSGNLS